MMRKLEQCVKLEFLSYGFSFENDREISTLEAFANISPGFYFETLADRLSIDSYATLKALRGFTQSRSFRRNPVRVASIIGHIKTQGCQSATLG